MKRNFQTTQGLPAVKQTSSSLLYGTILYHIQGCW